MFIVLVGSSAMASVGSYCATADLVEGDLRRALADTIAAKGAYYAANDTIRTFRGLQAAAGGNVVMRVDDATFRRNIASWRLRESAYLQVSIVGGPGCGGGPAVAGGGGIATDALVLRSADGASAVALRGCAGCSAASVLAMSDQRLPLALFAAALLWAFGCAAGHRRACLSRARAVAYAGLSSRPTAPCLSTLPASPCGSRPCSTVCWPCSSLPRATACRTARYATRSGLRNPMPPTRFTR